MTSTLVDASPWKDNQLITTELANATSCLEIPPSTDKPMWETTLESIVVIVITCMTIFGNITNILILRSLPSWSTNTGYFLINLAFTDLGVGVFLMSLAVYPVTVNLRHWPYGEFVCQLSSYLGGVFCSSSVISLCLISIDRYIAITKALKYYELMTERRCLFLILSLWLLTLFCYFPIFIDDLVGVQYNPYSYLCSPNFQEHFTFVIAVIIIFLLPSTSIMMFTYSKLLLISLHHSKKIHLQEQAASACSQQKRQIRKNRKAIKTLLIITGCFNLAWLPYTILSIYRPFQDPCDEPLPHWVEFVIPWLAMSNSFVNSIIYFAFNKEYRREAKKLFGFQNVDSLDTAGTDTEIRLSQSNILST